MQYFTPYPAPFVPGLLLALLPILLLVVLWTIILKGFALWHAARNSQKWWFIALLVINTLGILEIVYLIWFRPTSPYARNNHSHSHHSHTPAHESSPQ
jgi:methionyl-tRNA synthetase